MRRFAPCHTIAMLAGALLISTPIACLAQTSPGERVRLRFDTTEAAAVLAILNDQSAGRTPSAAAWHLLFATEGYQRLKAREAAMRRPMTDSAFAAFVLSDTLGRREPALRRALSAWERVDLQGMATMALAYLPPDARITATVYIVIKPRTNSFVWDTRTDPAIFLYLDPEVSPPQFANTVAHELHHIGFSSVDARQDSALAILPDSVRTAAEWMGALGEGFAMLAAAGGPDVHPHAASPAADRARWDNDMMHFNQDLRVLDGFFQDIITRKLATPDSVRAVAITFYGIQGPWYTVGWKMAVTIERYFGRPELIRAMTDPPRLLQDYNLAAAEYNRTHADTLALWSPELVAALGPPH